MERSRQGRGHSLLGHAPRDPFATADAPSAVDLSQRKAAVDFSDVFGGPPRRAPLYEGRSPALGGEGGRGVGGEGEAEERSRLWSSSVVEKPVFGGVVVGSPAHRRHLGEDFFSDIFRGNESACPTPRRKDQDLFTPSTPGSRVLSPSRPLPPTSDVFNGVSSLPAHLSYSSRLAKSFDYSSFRCPAAYAVLKQEESIPDVFTVPSSPNVCVPPSPNQFIQTKDGPRAVTHTSSRQSSLFHKIRRGNMPLKNIISATDGTDETEQLKKELTGSKAYGSSAHSQFSIYRWASKRVTLIMPSNFKERTKSGSRLSGVSSQVLPQADLTLHKENVLQGMQAFQNQSEMEGQSPFSNFASAENDNMASANDTTAPLPASSGIKSVLRDITDTTDDADTCIKHNRGLAEEEGKPELKNLHHVVNNNYDREGITRHAKKEKSLVGDSKMVMEGGSGTGKVKQENRINLIFGCTENANQDMLGASPISKDNILPGSAKGKVMEFVKIFNQEAAQKRSGTVETRSRSFRVKDGCKGRVEDHTSASVANADEDDNGNHGEASSTPLATGQSLTKEEQKTSVKSSVGQKMDDPSPEIPDASVSLSGSALGSLHASFSNMEEVHCESIEECLVETLSQGQNEVTETELQQETELKTSDTRIQEWSKGKEGNIRSLLSTLQYVLWPGSGWKPVPLVDIIEGASVRRAYQKALLCLHPDKLQQKGAEVHQKYVAEKVFDMLQESWTHFNSLSSL